eukprot:354255-Chlamydomonas_euryale.AAC.3
MGKGGGKAGNRDRAPGAVTEASAILRAGGMEQCLEQYTQRDHRYVASCPSMSPTPTILSLPCPPSSPLCLCPAPLALALSPPLVSLALLLCHSAHQFCVMFSVDSTSA